MKNKLIVALWWTKYGNTVSKLPHPYFWNFLSISCYSTYQSHAHQYQMYLPYQPFTCNSVPFLQLQIVGEKLGIAALILSLLALIINLAILFWLSWQRFSGMLTASNTAAKGKGHKRAFLVKSDFKQMSCGSF